jgi:hypothetical protein
MRNVPINSRFPGSRDKFIEAKHRRDAFDLVEDDFWEIAKRVWSYTLLSSSALYNIYQSVKYVVKWKVDGDFVECGVFFGGSIMFFVEMLRRY